MTVNAAALEGGFADPVMNSQATFRAIMDAMARPGSIVRLEAFVAPPGHLTAAAAAVACTLFDADTPVWLDAAIGAGDSVRAWLTFQTGAPLTEDLDAAHFALIADGAAMPPLADFAQGTQEYPDRSATIILQLPALDGGATLAFSGPGIRTQAAIAPTGLPADFVNQWKANADRFPRGVDLILTAGDTLVCLPRSARLVTAKD